MYSQFVEEEKRRAQQIRHWLGSAFYMFRLDGHLHVACSRVGQV